MRKMIVILFAATLLLLIGNSVWAQEEEDSPDKQARYHVEFTTLADHNTAANAIGVADAEQVIYTEPIDIVGAPNPKNVQDFGGGNQVDAIANRKDAYFTPVVMDVADLLFSCMGDAGAVGVLVEKSTVNGGGGGVLWVHAPDLVNPGGLAPAIELDALQVHGRATGKYGNRYSLFGDPMLPGLGDVVPYSVRAYTAAGADPGYVPKSDIIAAILIVDPNFIINGGDTNQVDLDGLMVRDRGTSKEWDFPDTILFSIRPNVPWDGGEIVVLENLGGGILAASYLFHDGHPWDTPFPVAATFGTGTENVDGIEADEDVELPPHIPTMTNWGMLILLALLILSGIIVIRHRRAEARA